MYCPNCSCELPAIAKFCVRCGAPTGFLAVGSGTQPYVSTPAVPAPVGRPDRAGDHAYCGRCGAKVIEGNHFCSTCGNPLPANDAPELTASLANSSPGDAGMVTLLNVVQAGEAASGSPGRLSEAVQAEQYRQTNRGGILGWIWPELSNKTAARKAIIVGFWVCIFIALDNAAIGIYSLTTGENVGGYYDAWVLVDGAAFAFIAWRLWKNSRIWAVIGLALWSFEIFDKLRNADRTFGVISVLLLLAILNATRGAFAFHRYTTQEREHHSVNEGQSESESVASQDTPTQSKDEKRPLVTREAWIVCSILSLLAAINNASKSGATGSGELAPFAIGGFIGGLILFTGSWAIIVFVFRWLSGRISRRSPRPGGSTGDVASGRKTLLIWICAALATALLAVAFIGLRRLVDPVKQLYSLEGHTEDVMSVAFSPDGRTLASGGDHTVRLWNVASGLGVRVLSNPSQDDILSVAFSPDGRTLASGGVDITLWDVDSGQMLRTLRGHTSWVPSVAFSPDGHTLASGSADHTVKLWDVSSGELLGTLEGHNDYVESVAFSPDGHTLASGSVDHTVKLWNVENGQLLRTLLGHTGYVYSVAFSPDGHSLASGSSDMTVIVWDVASGEVLRTLRGHTNNVFSVAFCPDGRVLATGSSDHTIKLWDLSSGSVRRTLQGHWSAVTSVAFGDGGHYLASGSFDRTVKLWNTSCVQY